MANYEIYSHNGDNGGKSIRTNLVEIKQVAITASNVTSACYAHGIYNSPETKSALEFQLEMVIKDAQAALFALTKKNMQNAFNYSKLNAYGFQGNIVIIENWQKFAWDKYPRNFLKEMENNDPMKVANTNIIEFLIECVGELKESTVPYAFRELSEPVQLDLHDGVIAIKYNNSAYEFVIKIYKKEKIAVFKEDLLLNN